MSEIRWDDSHPFCVLGINIESSCRLWTV